MLVAAVGRSGATRYCMDQAERLGIPFIGEITPVFIEGFSKSNAKELSHETGYAPKIPSEVFFDALVNKDKYVSLVNSSWHLVLPIADVLVLRKNIRHCFTSMANYLIKIRETVPGHGIPNTHIHLYMMNMFQSLYATVTYLERNEIPIVWYESYFNKPHIAEYLEKSDDRYTIEQMIDNMLDLNDLLPRFERLKETLCE